MNDPKYVKLSITEAESRLRANRYSIISGIMTAVLSTLFYFFIFRPINMPSEFRFLNGIAGILIIVLFVSSICLALYARFIRTERSYKWISEYVLILYAIIIAIKLILICLGLTLSEIIYKFSHPSNQQSKNVPMAQAAGELLPKQRPANYVLEFSQENNKGKSFEGNTFISYTRPESLAFKIKEKEAMIGHSLDIKVPIGGQVFVRMNHSGYNLSVFGGTSKVDSVTSIDGENGYVLNIEEIIKSPCIIRFSKVGTEDYREWKIIDISK